MSEQVIREGYKLTEEELRQVQEIQQDLISEVKRICDK